MKFIKNFILILLFILPISNSFGAMFTSEQQASVDDSGTFTSGIHFNPDGTKMFTVVSTPASGETYTNVSEYILRKPFDVSTKVYRGHDQRCILNSGDEALGPVGKVHDLEFSNDGLMLFVSRGDTTNDADTLANRDRVFRFDLTSPYDVSTCAFANQTSDLDTGTLQDGSNAGDITEGSSNRLQGFEINNDGTKLFAIFHGASSQNTRLLEYQLSTAYDLSTISIITDAGIELNDEASNPKGLRFSPDGKRFWVTDHQATATGRDVVQVSLDVAFSTSSFTIDGTASIADSNQQSNGIAFSAAGLKMYIPHENNNEIYEYHLVCPFNIIEGNCPPVTENSVRTGIAEAQIMIAKRTIDHSTKSVL
ncbi:secretion protein, partial [Candidatus Pelagibacter sp.]|nr:secretion protein [Candidatus Pelagibacter sp.]